MKILIIQQRYGIGDMVIFLPYIHAISRKFAVPVSLLAKASSKANDLFTDDSYIGEIITLDKEKDGFKGIFKLSNILKERNFDKVIIFNSSIRYFLISKIAGIKSIHQYPLFRSKDNLVKSAKTFTEKILNETINTEPNLQIKNFIKKKPEVIKSICLGISASGPTKRWDVDNYIKLCKELMKFYECKFYIAGGKSDIKLINKIKTSEIGNNCESFENLSIRETLPIIKNCDCYIGSDTGFAHLSVAMGVKALTLFMDSPVMAYGKYSKKMQVVEPVGEKDTTTHNTLGKDKISFDEVLKKSKEILN